MKLFLHSKQKTRSLIFVFCIFLFPFLGFSQAPVANFSASATEGCGVTVITFEDLSTNNPTSVVWNFGVGGNQTPAISADRKYSFIYSTPGIYTVRLQVTNASGSDVEEKVAFIKIYANPQAKFSFLKSDYCLGEAIQFTDESTSDVAITDWAWNFGDGGSADTQNPSHVYAAVGTYNLFLSITNANGCNSFYNSTSDITINSNPVAGFTAASTESCTAPFTANFSSASSIGASSYLWDFGDGTTSTDPNPAHTYTTSGNYSVSLTVTNAGGCKNTFNRPNYIHVNTFKANFTTPDNSVCFGTAASFTDASDAGVVSWVWDFGDLTTSSIQNPSRNYASSGNYTVSLTAVNGIGCSDTKTVTNFISVLDLPIVTIQANNTSSCTVPFLVNFSNNTPNATSWVWNFGDGTPTSPTQNPAHSYTAEGDYTVSLQVTDNNTCVNSITETNYIKVHIPKVNFMSDKREGCIPLTINYTDLSTSANAITDWFWEDGHGNTSTQQNPSFTYSNPTDTGLFAMRLTIIDNKNCTRTYDSVDYYGVGIVPVPEFSVDNQVACFRSQSQFTDLSTVGTNSFANQWLWDFGDGGTSTVKNPQYSYAVDTVEYTVTLIARHFGCAALPLVKNNYMKILPPIALYTVSPASLCLFPSTVEFTDDSKGAFEYEWDFSDGNIMKIKDNLDATYDWEYNGTVYADDTISKNPEHIFQTAGTYNTQLKVTNPNGCIDSLPIVIDVSQVFPGFKQDVDNSCQFKGITFIDTSKTDIGSITDWIWDFGDGTARVVGEDTVNHIYASPGIFDVEIIATNSFGCLDSITLPNFITIYELPKLQFSADVTDGCAPLTVNFSEISSATAPDSVVTWTWNFGDGNILVINENLDKTFRWTYNSAVIATDTTSKSPRHIYALRGNYTVTLTVTDTKGCDSVLVKTNYIKPTKPYAAFTVAPISCHYNSIPFTNISTGATSYEWDFDDGSSLQTGVSPSYKYTTTADANYTVTLRAIDDNLCDSIISTSITVNHPIADFYAKHVVIPCYTTQADTLVNTSSASVVSYSWYFEDPFNPFVNVSTLPSPTYQYGGPGIYDVQLAVKDAFGCVDTLLRPDYIDVGGPFGTFTFDPISACMPANITFTAVALNTTKYNWYYGNITQDEDSPLSTITKTYETLNIDNPVLVLEDDNGCMKTVIPSQNLTLYESKPDFEADIEFSCEDTVVVFTDLSTASHPIDSWLWDFGDGQTSDLQNPTHAYTNGLHTVQLTTTIGVCPFVKTMPQFIKVYQTPKASFTVSKNPAYMLEPIQFTNTSDSVFASPVRWIWDLGEGLEDTAKHQNKFYNTSGEYDILLQAYVVPECIDTAKTKLTIDNKVFIPNVFTPDDDGINDIFFAGMNLELVILNRWGQELYKGTQGWNGTTNGEKVAPGTYFYIITMLNGEQFKGPLTLLRK